jgi:hypothetical protein
MKRSNRLFDVGSQSRAHARFYSWLPVNSDVRPQK